MSFLSENPRRLKRKHFLESKFFKPQKTHKKSRNNKLFYSLRHQPFVTPSALPSSSKSNKKKNKRKNKQNNQQHPTKSNPGSFYSESKSNASKNRLPAWMQQAEEIIDNSIEDKHSEVLEEDFEHLEADLEEHFSEKRSENRQTTNMSTSRNFRPTGSHYSGTRGNKSTATGQSTGKSLPSWMQAAVENNEIDEDILDDNENFDDDHLNLDETAIPMTGNVGSHYSDERSLENKSRNSNRSGNNYGNSALSNRQASNFSQKSQESANWTQNRSYFLRMNKMKENDKSGRNWTKGLKNNSTPGKSQNQPTRDATIRALTDELDETKIIIKSKENEINELNEQINLLQENQIQEEVDRVEAEIGRERAINDSRQLRIDKKDLLEKLAKIEQQMEQQKLEMQQKIQEEAEKRLQEVEKVKILESELVKTKESAEKINNQMTALNACIDIG